MDSINCISTFHLSSMVARTFCCWSCRPQATTATLQTLLQCLGQTAQTCYTKACPNNEYNHWQRYMHNIPMHMALETQIPGRCWPLVGIGLAQFSFQYLLCVLTSWIMKKASKPSCTDDGYWFDLNDNIHIMLWEGLYGNKSTCTTLEERLPQP